MFRLLTKALVAATVVLGTGAGCRISLDNAATGSADASDGVDAMTSAACQQATTYQDLTSIETKIFKLSCTFSGCHNGQATDAGRLDYRPGMAYAFLVDKDSKVAPGRKLVVAGDPKASYLMLMLGQFPPAQASPPGTAPPDTIGLMPQGTGGALLCQEKRDAIERWITAGAPND